MARYVETYGSNFIIINKLVVRVGTRKYVRGVLFGKREKEQNRAGHTRV